MFQLVYLSSARSDFRPEALSELVVKARRNNAQAQISGLLLYHDRSFFQVLEGEEEMVRALFARIQQDPRHRHCFRLMERQIEARMFPDWSMGYATPEELEVSGDEGAVKHLKTIYENAKIAARSNSTLDRVLRRFLSGFRTLPFAL